MTSKQLNGFAKLLNKEMPGLNSTWTVCARLGEGFLVTRSRHTRGFPLAAAGNGEAQSRQSDLAKRMTPAANGRG